ncbi:MAG: sugar ABC transporter permease [Anaerolineales bacterium]|nr:sugar ABC transporter permease [Anaerolineales bacterium]MCB8954615.1 sugar ABC transporter permease [Ardenticatenales bacterium]
MSDRLMFPEEPALATPPTTSLSARIFAGRRGRRLREALLAYLFLLPAFAIIFVFGLFPLAFSVYESTLRGLNKIVGTFDGLGNYVKAIDNLTYVLAFWIALTFIYLAARRVLDTHQAAAKKSESPWAWAAPAIVMALALGAILRWVFALLPAMLTIPDKLPRGERLTRELFYQFAGEALREPTVSSAFTMAVVALLLVAAVWYAVYRLKQHSQQDGLYFSKLTEASILLVGALALSGFTWTEIQKAYAAALEAGESLSIYSQLVTISAGIVLLILSWIVWRSASHRSSTTSTLFRLAAAAALATGAWILIGELPSAIAAGNRDWWRGLQATVFFAIGTIPLQFIIALTLATILFQDIKGKTLFRMIYFMPYIAPLVGTAAAFRIIFSGRADAPMNALLTTIGLKPLGWLNEPAGIMQLIVGSRFDLPTWLAGPSLALVAIILFNVWTYVGFDMVIFLAGLGNIPKELYEAAAIDGSGRWAQFRHITLPLLSPTIYFLMLLAVIGTFKAFNHIYVMRLGAALGTTDTASVVIFQTFNRDTRYGYASALAILLLIIIVILTVINNRIASERVFYG